MNDKLKTELFASVNSNAIHSYHEKRLAKIQKEKQIQQRADREFGIYSLMFAATVLLTGFAF